MKKVIVTGANGYIGSSLISELVKKNVSVIALTGPYASSKLPESDLITCIDCSLDDEASIAAAIPNGEYDAFYHFAWQGVNGADKTNAAVQLHNIEMMLNCAAASKAVGCRKFLCAGTVAECSVESLAGLEKVGGGMMYGVSKHCAHIMLEAYCKNNGIDFVWMRFSNIYGPGNNTGNLVSYTVNTLKSGECATFGPAQQMYDFIYDRDLITAIIRLGECKTTKNAYFIGSGTPRKLCEYLYEIGSQCGMPEKIKIGERADDGIKYTADMFDTSDLVDEIGDYISVSFEEGIKKTLESF